MDINELKIYNPKLWKDGICRGAITYSFAGALTPGGPISNIFAEGFLGGPHPPIIVAFDPAGNIPVGASDSYPKPWRGASQKLQDGSYGSQIGPFARLVNVPPGVFKETCQEGQEDQQCKLGLFGRLGVGDGNQLGFRMQDWYGQGEGSYDTAYFNNQYGTQWDTWKDWWDNSSKTTVFAVWEDYPGSPTVEVEVAYDYISLGDDDYFPGLNGRAFVDNSLDLLVAMVGLAVLVSRW